jgi:hypothetical protein
MVTHTDVKALIEGRGLEPGEEDNPTVFNIVVERLMRDRAIETYDDLYAMFTEAGYEEIDLEEFLEQCDGTSDFIREDFVSGMATVLQLDREEKLAIAWANIWGREPVS